MNKRTRKLQFSKKEREKVKKRDRGCIFCRMGYHMELVGPYSSLEVMHYIPRSRGGLGVAENGALGCPYHHTEMDNGNKGLRREMLSLMRGYLEGKYPGWDEDRLIYRK